MKYIDEREIKNLTVLLRVDFNVSLNPDHSIANDERIRQSLSTIKYLLKNNNTLILISHLGQPKGVDGRFSLKPVVKRLQEYLPERKVTLFDKALSQFCPTDNPKQITVLENIRFFPGEKENDQAFAKELASLADIYVNDAFGVCHREDASVVSIPKYLPHYGGLLLKKEVEMLSQLVQHPKRPVVAILGGSKITTKITLINKLLHLADVLLIGGGLANNFIKAQGYNIGKSIVEDDQLAHTKHLVHLAKERKTTLLFPEDVIVEGGLAKRLDEITKDDKILDIGPATQATYGNHISHARTIVWNGPVGLFEDTLYRRGTDFIYYAITQNQQAISMVGGGDTLAAITNKEYLEKVTHISTGGGAMLEFIEKGTLPGIEALA